MLADRHRSVLLVVDLQPRFMKSIVEVDRAAGRALFLARVAAALGVPVYATEQNPDRMGGTQEEFLEILAHSPFPKMTFSCLGAPGLLEAMPSGRDQLVMVGIETHICVTQTSLEWLATGKPVIAAEDTMSASTHERHAVGLKRLRGAGVELAHSESIAYEWMRTAEDPQFRNVLAIVKSFQPS